MDGTQRHFGHLLALALLAASAATVSAQLDVDDTLAKLGDDDYAVRQSTWRRLLDDPDLTSEQIDLLYAASTTCEQRHRLLDVARHHLLRQIGREQFTDGAEACLGVGLGPIAQDKLAGIDLPASCIIRTYPGLPAFACLLAGDIILAVDGQRPEGRRDNRDNRFFIERIKAHRPGDEMRLTVRRDGRELEITVKLADRRALDGLYDVGGGRLVINQVQFDIRVNQPAALEAARLLPASAPIGVPLQRRHQDRWQQRRQELISLKAEADAPAAEAEDPDQ